MQRGIRWGVLRSYALILATVLIGACVPTGCGMDELACGVFTEEEFWLLVEHENLG